MIAGDVNGDGAINDRAFIFDPCAWRRDGQWRCARSSPSARARHARVSTRQLGQLAGRGSCQAPWTVANALQSSSTRRRSAYRSGRASRSVAEPTRLADLALHGTYDIRGWGQNIPPDQNLLFVRGFDAARRGHYKYDVNQRFGSTRPRESATTLPFISLPSPSTSACRASGNC